MKIDILIRGGRVIDGSGAPEVRADVAITDGRIIGIGTFDDVPAGCILDATDQVVAPGFIDVHTHADKTMLVYPDAGNYRMQGITTVVGGNCGSSPAPLTDYYAFGYWEWNWWYEVNPRMYYDEVVADLAPVVDAMAKHVGIDLSWRTFAEYLDRVDAVRPGVNLVPLVGHNALRTAVLGHDYRRASTSKELDTMKALIREAMDAGAYGISNGLDYAPGGYAEADELVAVVREAARLDGLFTSHWRRTGLRYGMGTPVLIRGLREALDIAEQAEAPRVQIAHLSPGFAMTPESTEALTRLAAEQTLEVMEAAIDRGLALHWDVIPNAGGGTLSTRHAASLLIPWLRMSGSRDQLAHNLRAPEFREDIRNYLESGQWYGLNPLANPGWAGAIRLTNQNLDAESLPEVAKRRGQDTLEALFDVLVDDPDTLTSPAPGSEFAHQVFYNHPRTMVGLDTFTMNDDYDVTVPPYYRPHANTYGGMPRFFQRFGIPQLGLAGAIHRVTGLPAHAFGLPERGLLQEGYWADVVVFDPNEYRDQSETFEPRRYAQGVKHLVINGAVSIADGVPSEKRHGRVLRK